MSRSYNFWILNHYAGNLHDGMEYRHFFLARHLRSMGHRVSIISSSYSHLYSKPPIVKSLVDYREYDGVEFIRLRGPSYNGNGVMRLLNMLSYSLLAQFVNLEKHIGHPDIILGSSPHPFVMWNTLKLANRHNAKSIIEIRDLWPLMLTELGSMTSSHPLAKIFQWLEGKAFREADRVISLWHSADDYMLKHGVDKQRYRYLPNGIELNDAIFSGAHPLLEALNEKQEAGCFVVGYGGSHGHANPLMQVVEACHKLQLKGVEDIAFFMVGDGPDKAEAMEEAKKLGLSNILWFESVSKDVIMAFYEKLDCAFIGLKDLPLFKYGPTPNKLMDYLAAGRPIIYAIRSSFDPVAEQKLGFSIQPDDSVELVNAMEQMRDTSEAERILMGKRARLFAEKEHSYSALAVKLNDINLEIL